MSTHDARTFSLTESMRRSSRRYTIIAILVAAAAFIAIASGGSSKNLVYYWTPTDLYANGETFFIDRKVTIVAKFDGPISYEALMTNLQKAMR